MQGDYASPLGSTSLSWAEQSLFTEDRKLLHMPELEHLYGARRLPAHQPTARNQAGH